MEAWKELTRLKSLANDARQRREEQWQDSFELMVGDQSQILGTVSRNGNYAPEVNRILNAVNNTYAIMTEIPIRPVMVPRNASEVIAEIIEGPLAESMKQAGLPPVVEYIPMAQQMGIQMPQENPVVRYDTDSMSHAMTDELHSQWVKSSSAMIVDKSNWEKLPFGHNDILIQWDADKYCFELKSLHPLNSWIDPWATGIHDAEFFIIREIISAHEAVEKYPELFPEGVEGLKNGGTSYSYDGGETSLGSDYDEQPNGIDTVERYVLFWRHQKVIDETAVLDELGAPLIDEEGNPVTEQVERVAPLVQMEFVNKTLVYKDESDFPDIPVARNLHIPSVQSPYGVGIPEYLGPLQGLYNRLWSICYEHALFYRAPMHVIPQSIRNKLKDYLLGAYSLAGQFIPVPDEIMVMFQGNPIYDMKPPELSPTVGHLMNLVSQEIDRLSGITNVVRGEAYSGWSGDLYQQATSNAKTPIGVSARNTGYAIQRLMKIAAYMTAKFTPPSILADRNGTYPAEAWAAFAERMESMDFDFEVQVSGSSRKDMEAQRMMQSTMNAPFLWQSETFVKNAMDRMNLPDGEQIATEVKQILFNNPQLTQASGGSGSKPQPQQGQMQ